MDCEIVLIGLNHRTAGVDVRERFALTGNCDPDTWALPCLGPLREAMILSTCNRVELLATGQGDLASQMLASWASARQGSAEELAHYIYTYKGLDAVRHLFSVASSLDSMVLGEPQILGQLKNAYRKAAANHSTGVILNRLLHKAFSVAKRVRTETAVAASAVSISYAAVELAKRIFGTMQEQTALLVGAGEMAELAATHLAQAGISGILVANRSPERARELAIRFGGKAIEFAGLATALEHVDIIITSTGSPEPVIRARDIRSVLRKRRNRPMFFIDIAVPRDVDPDVNALDNVYLYDIDDLKEVVEENQANRRDEAVRAAQIVEEEVAAFGHWLSGLDAQPTIVDLINRGERAAAEELARGLRHIRLDEGQRQAVELMLNALVRKLNHAPLTFLKDAMHDEGVDSAGTIALVRKIFALDASHSCSHSPGHVSGSGLAPDSGS